MGGEALGDRGGEARLVDDGEVARLVNSKLRQTFLLYASFTSERFCSMFHMLPLVTLVTLVTLVQGERRQSSPGSAWLWPHAQVWPIQKKLANKKKHAQVWPIKKIDQ